MFEVSEAFVQRSSRPKVFYTKGVLKNFTKFTGKHVCQSLFFNKVADLRPFNQVADLRHRCFPVDFAKFLRTPFLQWLNGFFTPPVAASEVYFSSHQRNIVREYKLHGEPTVK